MGDALRLKARGILLIAPFALTRCLYVPCWHAIQTKIHHSLHTMALTAASRCRLWPAMSLRLPLARLCNWPRPKRPGPTCASSPCNQRTGNEHTAMSCKLSCSEAPMPESECKATQSMNCERHRSLPNHKPRRKHRLAYRKHCKRTQRQQAFPCSPINVCDGNGCSLRVSNGVQP